MARVLLVEPDRVLARNYQKALTQAGHIVDWQSNGQAAVHAVDENKPDIVLLELQMPAHNGLSFLHEFRSYPEWQNIHVILLTIVPDLALASDQSTLKDLGVSGYLYKPQTKLRHVIRAVERALQSVSI